MADVFTASLVRGVGEAVEDLLSCCATRGDNTPAGGVLGCGGGGGGAHDSGEPTLTALGREGLWLLGLCTFDLVMAVLAAALCLFSPSSPSSSSSSLTSSSSSASTTTSSSPLDAPASSSSSWSGGARGTPSSSSSSSSSSSRGGSSGSGSSSLCRGRRYPACSYVHPLQIAEDFRDRWRTRWTHQQYFEVMTYHNGDQFEVKNFRPVKNTFIQQRPGRMEHEISVSDYKRHCELAKKIVGYESINDFKIKHASVVYRNYFRRTNEDMSQQKPVVKAPKKNNATKHASSPETSPRDIVVQTGPKRSMVTCTLCSRQYEYVTQYLAACAQSLHSSKEQQQQPLLHVPTAQSQPQHAKVI